MANPQDSQTRLEQLRVECLSKEDLEEWHAGAVDGKHVLSPQNEAAALTKLQEEFTGFKGRLEAQTVELQHVCNSYLDRTQNKADSTRAAALQAQNVVSVGTANGGASCPFPEGSEESDLLKWGASQGIITSLVPASFPTGSSHTSPPPATAQSCAQASEGPQRPGRTASGAAEAQAGLVRGLQAPRDIPAGHTLISVPRSCLITYQTALQSDLGACLRRIPGLDEESAAVLWTMLDRHDPESPHAPFWAALPRAFGTALGVSGQVLCQHLRQAPGLLKEATEARQHVRHQYQALSGVMRALLSAYPQHIQAEHLTYESYLWAVQLWYAYAIQVRHWVVVCTHMQVQMPDGSLHASLVPVVSLMNHSPWPHSVAFSRLDERTQRLNVKCFRSVQAGEQVLLSYGALPNSKLLLFYGFAVPGNPYDTVELTLTSLPVILNINKSSPGAEKDSSQGSTQQSPVGNAVGEGQGAEQQGCSVVDEQRAQLLQMSGLSLTQRVRLWGTMPPLLFPTARLLTASQPEVQQLLDGCQAASLTAAGNSQTKSSGAGRAGGKGSKAGKKRSVQGEKQGASATFAATREYLLHKLQNVLSVESELRAILLVMEVVRNLRQDLMGNLDTGLEGQAKEKHDAGTGRGRTALAGHEERHPTGQESGNGDAKSEGQESDSGEADVEGSGAAGFADAVAVYLAGQVAVLEHVQAQLGCMLASQHAAM